jgi:hypothetical protein
MIGNATTDRQFTIYVDATPTAVTLTHITDDDNLDSLVLKFTPANAYRLAQMLIVAAEAVEMP